MLVHLKEVNFWLSHSGVFVHVNLFPFIDQKKQLRTQHNKQGSNKQTAVQSQHEQKADQSQHEISVQS